MKKRILVLAAIFGASASFAQVTTLKSKKGFEILPEAGDYAIQFDATPMLDFALNVTKIGANGAQTAGGTAAYVSGFNNTIVGKYFVDASTAYRVKVGINTNSTKTTITIPSIADPAVTAEQYNTSKFTQIVLGGGMEWRRGHNRLQGFYGGEAMVSIGSLTPLLSTEYSEDLNVMFNDYGLSTETVNKGSQFGFGLRGFVGVEYFVLPKISLGAEFGWGLAYSSGSTETTTRVSDGTTITETTTANPKQSSFGFRNDVSNTRTPLVGATGNLVVTFLF